MDCSAAGAPRPADRPRGPQRDDDAHRPRRQPVPRASHLSLRGTVDAGGARRTKPRTARQCRRRAARSRRVGASRRHRDARVRRRRRAGSTVRPRVRRCVALGGLPHAVAPAARLARERAGRRDPQPPFRGAIRDRRRRGIHLGGGARAADPPRRRADGTVQHRRERRRQRLRLLRRGVGLGRRRRGLPPPAHRRGDPAHDRRARDRQRDVGARVRRTTRVDRQPPGRNPGANRPGDEPARAPRAPARGRAGADGARARIALGHRPGHRSPARRPRDRRRARDCRDRRGRDRPASVLDLDLGRRSERVRRPARLARPRAPPSRRPIGLSTRFNRPRPSPSAA